MRNLHNSLGNLCRYETGDFPPYHILRERFLAWQSQIKLPASSSAPGLYLAYEKGVKAGWFAFLPMYVPATCSLGTYVFTHTVLAHQAKGEGGRWAPHAARTQQKLVSRARVNRNRGITSLSGTRMI